MAWSVRIHLDERPGGWALADLLVEIRRQIEESEAAPRIRAVYPGEIEQLAGLLLQAEGIARKIERR